MKDFLVFSMTIVYRGSNMAKYCSHRIKLRAEEQLGLTELTVNSCFSALSLFSSIHFSFLCAPTSIFFAFLSKKVPEKGVAFQIFYIPLHTDTHSAHAELKLSLFVAYKSIVSYLKVPLWYAPLM